MPINTFTYIAGASAAVYTMTCLLCGLQLYGHVFFQKWKPNLLLSKVLGIVLLMMATAGISYMVAAIVPSLAWLMVVGQAIDLVMFTGLASVAHILYSNNHPSTKTLLLLAWPYVAIVGLYFVVPEVWQNHLLDFAMLILMAQYIYYAHKMHRRERLLEDLYSDPESHSLKWIWSIIAINTGWWIIRYTFGLVDCLNDWMYIAAYIYMTGYILFVFTKVINYGEPVSAETQQQIEEIPNLQPTTCNLQPAGDHLVDRLKILMEQEQLYLNPDLTVEDVAQRLSVTPQYLSVIINNDMHANFSQFVNSYRVERAKELLQTTDDKVEYIGAICGFNSRQAFRRIFTQLTGVSPTDFRK